MRLLASYAVSAMKKRLFFILSGLLLLAVLAAAYFAYQYAFTPEALKRREIEKWTNIVGKSVTLPQGEMPTIATVTNKNKLYDQAFFHQSQNGDKLLIYPQSGKTILYRPSSGKILDMTTVNIEK